MQARLCTVESDAVCTEILEWHLLTVRLMLSHFTRSISARTSPRPIMAPFSTSYAGYQYMSPQRSAGETNLNGNSLLLDVCSCFVMPIVYFHLDPGDVLEMASEGVYATYSCFRFAISSCILTWRDSTSRLSAEVAVLIAAVSFRVRIVISVRASDMAALKRYASCNVSE